MKPASLEGKRMRYNYNTRLFAFNNRGVWLNVIDIRAAVEWLKSEAEFPDWIIELIDKAFEDVME